MPRELPIVKVLRVDLDEPLEALEVHERYAEVLLVCFRRGRIIGEVRLPALSRIPADLQRAAIGRQLGDALFREELASRFLHAVGASAGPGVSASVSVVVCTRERAAELERCLEGLLRLDPAPLEIVVVDNCPATDATRALCERSPVRYVVEPVAGASRARNRGIVEAAGDVLAFTDDDCVPDAGWLASVGRELADPRVAAVTGAIEPLELETPAQVLFEAHGGFGRGLERRVVDGLRVDPARAAGTVGVTANLVVRRSVFDRTGLFAEWLGGGTPARGAEDYELFCRILEAGDRIVFDPGQLVWHRHREDLRSVRRLLFDYAVAGSALATQRVVLDRDRSGFRILAWWWLDHVPSDLGKLVARRASRVPLSWTLGELAGTLAGPWRLWRSRRARRRVEPLALLPHAVEPVAAIAVAADAPTLSVVVPSSDRRGSLERLLAGIAVQGYPPDRLEAVVVLDGCTDGSAAMLEAAELPYRLVVRELAKAGVGAVRNAGVSAASHDVIVFLDDDVEPAPGCLAGHAAAHAGGRAGLVLGYAPPVVDGGWWGDVVRAWWEEHFRQKAAPGHCWSYRDFVTVNSSIARDLILDHGGFDERFATRHEDWELGVRLLAGGVRFAYQPAVIAGHRLDTSFAGACERQRDEARADVLLARVHPFLGAGLALAGYRQGRPGVDEQDLATGPERAAALERRRRRRQWRELTGRLLQDAYVLGLRDELPSEEAFARFVDELCAGAPIRAEVSLDDGGPLSEPPQGATEVAVRVAGRTVARCVAADPGNGWDWHAIARRLQRESADELRTALVRDRLDRFHLPRPHDAQGVHVD